MDVDWAVQQGKVARALAADTDLVPYFAYMVSNRACARAQAVAAALSELAVLAEGWKYPAAEVKEPVRLQRLLSTLDGRTSLGDEDVSRISDEVAAYTRQELAPQVSRRGRTQVRGQEATAAYTSVRTDLARDWKRLRAALSAPIASRRFTQDKVRAAALAVPLASLNETLSLLDQSRLTDFTVQLSAAAASVAALGRPLDLRVRLRAGSEPFPDGLGVATTVNSTGLVTGLAPTTPPRQLGVRSGDLVTAKVGTATVLTVGEKDVVLGSSTISDASEVEIRSAPYVAWEDLVRDLDALLPLLPEADGLVPALQALEGDRSAGRIRAVMELAVKLAVVLHEASSEALAALERVGGEPYVLSGQPIATLLRAFTPTFGSKTRQGGDKLLSDLEGRGFDYAVEMLYGGQVDDLLDASAAQASRVGRVTEIASTLGTYTGGARGVG